MNTISKANYIIVLIAIIFFISCKKETNNLYSISISPNNMIGTPAEKFSLGQIKMFQASNNLVSNLIAEIGKDSLINNFSFAPLYLINNILCDTSMADWQNEFFNKYNLIHSSYKQIAANEKTFISTVKDIDSSINITSFIDFTDASSMTVKQDFEIELMYSNLTFDNIDNIFTTVDNKKPRLDFITLNGDFRTLTTEEEQVNEIPIGNGNYMLMLILPLHMTIKEYISDFSEKKYFFLVNRMQERKISLSFPMVSTQDSLCNIPMPQFVLQDSTVSFPKQLNVFSSFRLTTPSLTNQNAVELNNYNNSSVQNNSSETLKYSSPFMYIIRGKNSNLIMFVGVFCRP